MINKIKITKVCTFSCKLKTFHYAPWSMKMVDGMKIALYMIIMHQLIILWSISCSCSILHKITTFFPYAATVNFRNSSFEKIVLKKYLFLYYYYQERSRDSIELKINLNTISKIGNILILKTPLNEQT